MKLHQLHCLIAVAEEGSIGGASRLLHLTQPAVSRALLDLEDELGAPLFIRSSKGVQLTLYGQSLLRHSRLVAQELRHARDEITTLLGIEKGVLTIGVTPVTALGPFQVALQRFMAAHPDVAVSVIELRPIQLYDGLSDGSIDFGMMPRTAATTDNRFHWEPLFTMPTAIAVRKEHPIRGVKSLAALNELPWMSSDVHKDSVSIVGTLFEANGVPPPKRLLRCTSTALYIELAATTDVISVWSQLAFDTPWVAERIRKVRVDAAFTELTVGMLCSDLTLATTIAQSFMKEIRNACEHYKGIYNADTGKKARRRL